jgi:hypothetical protein
MATKSHDQDREEVRRELKSGRHDPSAAPQPQEVRKHPTEGEKMQFGYATPHHITEDLNILPDHGKPVPESLKHEASNHGVLDPAEAGHPLPEGLERKRAVPLDKSTGRRSQGGKG